MSIHRLLRGEDTRFIFTLAQGCIHVTDRREYVLAWEVSYLMACLRVTATAACFMFRSIALSKLECLHLLLDDNFNPYLNKL